MTAGELDDHISTRLRGLEIGDAVRARDVAALNDNIRRVERLMDQLAPIATQVAELTLQLASQDRRWDDAVHERIAAQSAQNQKHTSRSTALIAIAVAAVLNPVVSIIVTVWLNSPKRP